MRRPVALAGLIAIVASNTTEAQHAAPAAATLDCATTQASTQDHATMDHAAHSKALAACAAAALPTIPAQAAFAAIGQVVSILKADAATDWSKVNIEALRQHLIDMDDVTMRSIVKQRNVPGGVEAEASGTGRTIGAIQRLAGNHVRMLAQGGDYQTSVVNTASGARVVFTAKHAADTLMVRRIRGLGFTGILTEGDHHARHHLAIARGEAVHSH